MFFFVFCTIYFYSLYFFHTSKLYLMHHCKIGITKKKKKKGQISGDHILPNFEDVEESWLVELDKNTNSELQCLGWVAQKKGCNG